MSKFQYIVMGFCLPLDWLLIKPWGLSNWVNTNDINENRSMYVFCRHGTTIGAIIEVINYIRFKGSAKYILCRQLSVDCYLAWCVVTSFSQHQISSIPICCVAYKYTCRQYNIRTLSYTNSDVCIRLVTAAWSVQKQKIFLSNNS